MARSINRVEMLGYLSTDPELRNTPQGVSVCTLRIETYSSYKDKISGEWKETTEWHRVVLWEKLAEDASKYLKKGSRIYTEGKLKTRSYEDKDGNTRYMTEIYGNSLIILDSKTTYSNQSTKDETSPNLNNYVSSTEEDDDIPF